MVVEVVSLMGEEGAECLRVVVVGREVPDQEVYWGVSGEQRY